jgi:hypothetical protein
MGGTAGNPYAIQARADALPKTRAAVGGIELPRAVFESEDRTIRPVTTLILHAVGGDFAATYPQ